MDFGIGNIGSGISNNFIQILQNLESSYSGIYGLIFGLSYFSGFLFFLLAIFMMKKASEDHRSEGAAPIVWTLIVAVMLISLPEAISMGANTVFSSQKSILDYQDLENGNYGTLDPVFKFVQLIGVIAYVKGIFLCKKLGEQNHNSGENFNKAIVFLLVGILAIHIKDTLLFVGNTVGMSSLTQLIGA